MTAKIKYLTRRSLTLAISRHSGDLIPNIDITCLRLSTINPTLLSCSTHNTKKTRRTTPDSSTSSFSSQPVACSAWISVSYLPHWCTNSHREHVTLTAPWPWHPHTPWPIWLNAPLSCSYLYLLLCCCAYGAKIPPKTTHSTAMELETVNYAMKRAYQGES